MLEQVRSSARAHITNAARRFTRPAVYQFPLSTRQIAGPIQFTEGGVFAWFVLDAINWEFKTLDERVGLWDSQRAGWGQIATGLDDVDVRPFHLRRTTMPYAASEAAARLDADSHWLPAVDDCENADTYLDHMQDRLQSTGLDQKLTAVGVWLGPVPSADALEDLVSGSEHPRVEAVRLIQRLKDLDVVMAGGGLGGRLASAGEMAFLMHRSLSMGVPAPAAGTVRWRDDEMGEFTGRREWVVRPFTADPVQVNGEADGTPARRFVVTLRMGVMPAKTWPESGADAWMMSSDRLGFPVEWSVNGELWTGPSMRQETTHEFLRAKSIREHHEEHEIDVTPEIDRQIEEARETSDQVNEGDPDREAWRAKVTICASVFGETAELAEDRARMLKAHYRLRAGMPLERTTDQGRALREQVPGEPRVRDGWTRRLTPGYMAAMPNIDSVLGTPTGFYLGSAMLSNGAVLFDPHWGPENNRPGLITIDGEPGSGKSYLTGSLVYSMAMTGRRTVVQDPSGLLAELCRLPELAPYSRELNLSRADEGTLSPPQMVPEPLRDNYRAADGSIDYGEYLRAVKIAKAERAELSVDVLKMLLPPSLLRTDLVDQWLADAVRAMVLDQRGQRVDPTRRNLRWAVDYLGGRSDMLAQRIYRELKDASEYPLGSLIIPDHTDPVDLPSLGEEMLLVITTPGITAPAPGSDPERWNIGERYSQPLMHLAAFLASRSVYSRPREERKAVAIDEGDTFLQHASGRALFRRLGSDSRKFDVATLFASQHPEDRKVAGKRLDALIGASFVGKLSKRPAAEEGCRALDASEEYAPVLARLQAGQFALRDPLGRVGTVQVDGDWHPSLRRALDTTPVHEKAERADAIAPPPRLDAELLEKLGVAS